MGWRDRAKKFGWTHWALIGIAVFLIGFDLWIAHERAKGTWMATESQVLLDWALEHPVVPFVMGVLCGHWFWPQASK